MLSLALAVDVVNIFALLLLLKDDVGHVVLRLYVDLVTIDVFDEV